VEGVSRAARLLVEQFERLVRVAAKVWKPWVCTRSSFDSRRKYTIRRFELPEQTLALQKKLQMKVQKAQ
jgi:hypothetical protein